MAAKATQHHGVAGSMAYGETKKDSIIGEENRLRHQLWRA